ncbi:hypothetical protein [Streptomyces sp. NPDC056188]|uniref:hypothetical protein n=1 Tax=Streptomyces sp. NPDC056188 TaxID=3345740 RepID=UPI0035D60829
MSINHRVEAEKHLETAARHLTEVPADMRIAEVAAAIGQGHAALARDEERAATTADLRDAITLLRRREQVVRELVASHIVEALASQDRARRMAALHLTRDLDEADANVDDLINAQVPEEGWALVGAPEREPWEPAPNIPGQIPEPVRRVIAGHLAEALLDGRDGDVQKWARGIAYELKREGADLTEAIKARITDLTLGRDPSEPPF